MSIASAELFVGFFNFPGSAPSGAGLRKEEELKNHQPLVRLRVL